MKEKFSIFWTEKIKLFYNLPIYRLMVYNKNERSYMNYFNHLLFCYLRACTLRVCHH